MRALHPSQLVSPAVTRKRPSGSAVTVGYQRATGMEAAKLQARVAGSKMLALVMPTWAVPVCPPAVNTRPSGSSAWPEQKRLAVMGGIAVRELVAGSKIMEPLLSVESSQNSTLPVGSRLMWTATTEIGRA